MNRRLIAGAAVAGLVAAAILYTTRLQFAPMYLMHDEVNFALQAQSVAATGRDTNGRLLPVYFAETGFGAGRDPVVIYATALMLRLRPLSESAVRLPTALIGVLSIVLTFLLARRLFGSDGLGLAAAGMVALTPALFINSRLVLSIVYPIPFILGWLFCLSDVDARERGTPPWLGTAILGLGVYSYLASVILMPLYLVLTLVFLRAQGRSRSAGGAIVGFAVALVPLIAWQLAYPGRYSDVVTAYQPQGGDVQQRLSVFWMFFNPDYLFLSGDSRLTNSTRAAGLFPIAFAILVPVGVYRIVRSGDALSKVILAGFLTAPLASVVSGRLEINRVLFVIPFGALTAAYGVQHLWSRSSSIARWAAVALVAGIPLQFAFFYADYMGRYRTVSGIWFGGNQRGAVEAVLARDDVGSRPLFLNRRTPIERYWRFYALARDRADLVDLPTYYEPERFDPATVPPSAVAVCESGHRLCATLAASPEWRRLEAFVEPDGAASLELFERSQPAR